MVRRHQAQRLAADDPCAIELAAAEQHQAEAMIVVQRRGEPATARMEAAVLGPAAAVAGVELPHLLLRVEGIAVGQPVLLVDGHPKAGVGHAERIEDALLEHRSEEHTSELQSLMRISYAVFCLK